MAKKKVIITDKEAKLIVEDIDRKARIMGKIFFNKKLELPGVKWHKVDKLVIDNRSKK